MQYLKKKSSLQFIQLQETIILYNNVQYISINKHHLKYLKQLAKYQMSLEQKQEYLRKQIVDKGLNAEQFYEFWQSFGVDLSNATMNDVISIVTEFQSKTPTQQNNDDQFGQYVQPTHNQHQHDSHFYQDLDWDFLAEKTTDINKQKNKNDKKHSQKQSLPAKKEQQNLVDIESSNPKKSQGEKNNKKMKNQVIQQLSMTQKQKPRDKHQKLNQKQIQLLQQSQNSNINNVTFQQVMKDSQSFKRKCLKLQPNILQHHANVQIFITKYKQITDESTGIINKIWKATYMLFTIKTVGRNKQKAIGISWEVQRQHADFQWLRNTLIKMHPAIVVPPLPSIVKSIDQLNGYQRKLQSFLLDCYRCPQLRNSKYFQVFLSYSSAKDFEGFKKTCQNTSKPKNLSHIINMEGQIQLLYSDKMDGYSDGLQNFLNRTSQHLKNVKTIIKQIDQFYSSISNKYKQLSQVFTVMSEQSCDFCEQQCYPRLTETYRQISQLVNQHSYFCMLQKQFLQTFMFSHFAFERDRVDNMQGLIAKRKLFITQYSKPKHQVEKPTNESGGTSVFGKIAGLFGQKVESMDVPSTQTNILKDQVGYYNSQLLKQSIRSVQGMISSHVNHFSIYGHSRIDNVQQMQKLWSKLLVQLSRLNSR